MIFFILVIVIVLLVLRYMKRKEYGAFGEKPTPINTHYESEEGDFVIKGNKNKFFIEKDNGLVFEVVNGQIVSVTNNNTKHIYEVD